MTRERISRILELRETLTSFQTGFNLANAAVACAIVESTSGLEPDCHRLLNGADFSFIVLNVHSNLLRLIGDGGKWVVGEY